MPRHSMRPVRVVILSAALVAVFCGDSSLRPRVLGDTSFVQSSSRGATCIVSQPTLLRALQDMNQRYRLSTSYSGIKEGLNTGCTLLMEHAMNGDIEGMMEVIKSGVRIDEKDEHGWTALRYAVRHERFEAVKLLLKMGAKIDSTSVTGRTALMSAAGDPGKGSLLMCKLLVQSGADVCKRDTKGRDLFDWATLRGSTDIAELRAFVEKSTEGCAVSPAWLNSSPDATQSEIRGGRHSDFAMGG